MNFRNIELPSNRRFGFFFTAVFIIASAYFHYIGNDAWLYVFVALSMSFLTITVIKADVLLPLNKLWMMLGLLLGMIVSPIVMGFIFFGIFTPTAVLMRLARRDELRLRVKTHKTYWIKREKQPEAFKYQF